MHSKRRSIRRTRGRFVTYLLLLIGTLHLADTRVHAFPVLLDPTFDGDGKVITSFDPYVGNPPGNDMVVQPDGKILVVGSGLNENILVGHWLMSRYNPDGTLDTTFGTGGRRIVSIGNTWDRANSVALQSDGKIVVAGDKMFNTGDAYESHIILARFNPDGSFDGTFAGAGVNEINIAGTNSSLDVAVLPSGKIALVGTSNTTAPFLIVFDSGGVRDPGFNGNGLVNIGGAANAVAGQTDGKVLVAGSAGSNFAVWRYNANGTLDTGFDGDGLANVPVGIGASVANEMIVKPDGKILSVGTATGTNDDVALVQFNTNGSLDTTFDGDGKATADSGVAETGRDLALQADGKIVVAAGIYEVFEAMRFLASGAIDTTFDGDGIVKTTPVAFTDANAVAVQADGRILVTGSSRQTGFVLLRYAVRGGTPFDFDGDAKTDISIYRPGPGEWWYLKSSNGGNGAFQFGSSTDKIVPGDYTGDGKTDIAIWRSGEWFILRSEDNSYFSHPFGTVGDIPAPADFDGDGKTDETVFRPSTATWYELRSGGGTTIQQFGQTGDAPVSGDYDGDGKADIAIFRPSLGQWWLLRSSAGAIAFQFGSGTDKAVPGDYTGDGKTDVAFWRPSTGEWFVLRSEDNSYYAHPFGLATDVPAPGDYDGDGRADAAVFRPSTSTWFVNRTTAGTLIQNFGQGGDLAVPNAFVR